jgi:ABC transporter fused permease/ATP-binding protein
MTTKIPPPLRTSSLRRLLGLARPERNRLILGTLCLAVGSLAGLLFPQVIRMIVDQSLAAAAEVASLDQAALMLLVIFLVQAITVALRYALFTIAGERTVTRLRADLFAKLLSQEVAFFDERKTGELVNRLASDTTVLQNTVSVNISMGLRFLASILGGIGFLFYTSPRLTLVMLAVVPPVALGAVGYGRRVRNLSREVQDSLAVSSEVAEETLGGIRTVRAFAAEGKEEVRYRTAVEHSFGLARRRSILGATFVGIGSFAAYAALAAVLWYGGHLVSEGALTPGGLTSFLVYTLLVAVSLGGFGDLWADFMKASGAAERIFELLDRAPTMPLSGGERPAEVKGEVRFEAVRFAYPTRPDAQVLAGIDVTIAPGEMVALVGPSGSGKSTMAALLTRLYDPGEGAIFLDGRDLRTLSPDWLRRQIGVVSQEPLLFSCSIEENIRYGKQDATPEEIQAAARAANAHEFVSRFPEGYRTLVGERGAQLSGGQKQRIAIARAVLKDPRVLVLDEATSALDAESEHLVKEALDRLMAGRTTLVIAHRLSTVADADRVYVVEGGQIVQSGPHAQLVAEEGLYRRLVEKQFVAA